MLYKEINQKFTEKVAELMAKGYTINTATMEGTQGEIAHVDLTDGKDIYRVLLKEDTITPEGELWRWGERVISLTVGKSTGRIPANSCNTFHALWNNDLEIIEVQEFFQIGSNRSGEKFYGTKDEADAAARKRLEREAAHRTAGFRRTVDITSDKTVDIMVPFIQRERNIEHVSRQNIRVEKDTCESGKKYYTVKYYSNKYRLA